MKLAFSNIAWSAEEDAAAPALLRGLGVQGVEVAPTRLWPDWAGATPEAASAFAETMHSAGLATPSFQSLLFGRPDLQVFGSPQQQADLIDHLARVARVAAAMQARVLVFGSPKNRDRGELDPAQAMDMAVEFFRRAGQVCADAGVKLGIEANPAVYGCNFVTRWAEAEELVRRCSHPGIGLHLDTACTLLAGDDPVAAVPQVADILVHVHASEPELGPFANPRCDHAGVGAALRAAAYGGWCSVEMRRTATPLASVEEAARVALRCYG
jgi:D-psicose/D-tagatose/L-ribulose 3-epimerase